MARPSATPRSRILAHPRRATWMVSRWRCFSSIARASGNSSRGPTHHVRLATPWSLIASIARNSLAQPRHVRLATTAVASASIARRTRAVLS
ncbi:hypothetical protein SAMN02745121_07143 [Nannocystis exedens]|uniref:Uncharacterized protein n=1 Tax=Nannocystis exedens TaxID=54 RepID=A0A1I2GAQ2_9BACT|nr:hypothetical protein NAEX_00388 [Nannocystis exedens]SFF14209.1 hypothetical protein SAMN02745121_07143 [Nannocystis exedens]